MNNDMVNNNKPHINTPKINNINNLSSNESALHLNAEMKDSTSMDNSLYFLETIGKALVQKSKNKTAEQVKKSSQIFMEDPLYVESYINFSDDLVDKGYDLNKAVLNTDLIFENLKSKSIYEE